ncbi:MAG: D-tyrosyl-tRNA(Tyr) deacylase [Bacteroidetes bacterium]|uniref:D-aminoacyl-tRNA deacylase n=1 Tax=Phaeocystidibacter marisrubri TaxID=1577780 RepID=A0A6L3ZF47_9FLAO|nr:D-aminoacyl-tRNA deacylase [Phaeocystidibacter marisrubri]KAB2816094.1 D-tyrosyl-tRNA(Tyr) deacylase [Phaeocystidibacter marisrubri]TNE26248.1 MAG: D-tyrosyl-tRNA(Tyr) deacylase [Bacteroidota bacterium]GGH67298.1 D-aminoacyl-tRNA deacylase [Phaeocystidibacter marisrubri]
MRVLLQRVNEASVTIDGNVHSSIEKGMLILLGVEEDDTEEDANWLCSKLAKLRIYPDSEGVMNRSIVEVGGDFLVVSQFTLHASYKKGNRPSYIRAARPEKATALYEYFLDRLWHDTDRPVKSGVFGADMKVSLINDGPVTIWMDSKNKE